LVVVRPYRLSISMHLPKIATEGEPFQLTYEVKNIDNVVFPGGGINVIMYWPTIGNMMIVGHPLTVPTLAPGASWVSHKFTEKPLVSGYTVFVPNNIPFVASDGKPIELYLSDGVTLSQNRPIDAVRAKTHEEISQKQSVQVALVSLVFVAIFEVANLIVALLK
jgi:hypothetical protein